MDHDGGGYMAHGMRTVLHWLTPTSCHLIIFNPYVTANARLHQLQSRRIGNWKLSSNDVGWIGKFAPSKDVQEAISKLRFDKTITIEDVLMFPWGLNIDDSLSDVRQKLTAAVFLPGGTTTASAKDMDSQVYAWYTSSYLMTDISSDALSIVCLDAVAHAFKSSAVIPKSELVSFASCHIESITPFDPDKEKDELLTQWQAYKTLVQRLSQARVLRVSKPLDFTTKLDGYDVRMPTHPFLRHRGQNLQVDGNMVMGDGTPRHLYTVSGLEGNILSTIAPKDSQLNVCAASSVMRDVMERVSTQRQDAGANPDAFHKYWLNGFVRKYFPFLTEAASVKLVPPPPVPLDANRLHDATLNGAYKGIQRREQDIHITAGSKDVKVQLQESAVSYLQVRVNEHNINGQVDLRSVFEVFHVSKHVPMMIYYDGDTTLYKLDANESRAGVIPFAKIASWIQRKPVQRPDEAYLQFISSLPPPNDKLYCKVIVKRDLSYEIRQHLPFIMSADETTIQSVVMHVGQSIIKTIQSLLTGRLVRIAMPDAKFMHHHHTWSSTRLANCVITTVYQSPTTLPSLHTIEKAVTNSFMQTHFAVIAKSASSLVLKYRRCDVPTRQTSVNDVIRSMRDMPKEDIVIQLQDMFNMDTGTAIAQVEEWFLEASLEREFEGGQRRLYSGYSDVSHRPVIIRISNPHKITGCTVLIEGITNFESIARMAHVIRVLLGTAMTPDAGAQKKKPTTRPPASNANVNQSDLGNVDVLHELDDDADLKALFDSELDTMLNTKTSTIGTTINGNVTGNTAKTANTAKNANAGKDEDDVNIKSNKVILNRLYRADPALFQAKLAAGARYSRVCVKSDARQPIVISPEEKSRIDKVSPGSYEGFVRAGSTPDLAQKNIYICPYVWCPKSRISMSEEQFNKNGKRCPKSTNAENEVPIVLNAKYWQGRKRHPGLLEARHHPQGMCMPCCFAKPNRISAECAVTKTPGPNSNPTNSDSSKKKTNANSGEGNRYIRGDVYPLGTDTYGVMPLIAAKFLGNARCGNRDDGSGQIVSSTRCFVRRGLHASKQPFFEALAHVTRTQKGPDTDADIIRRIRESLTLPVYLSIQDGDLCRRFMPSSPPLTDAKLVDEFARWVFATKDDDDSVHKAVSRAKASGPETLKEVLSRNLQACMEFVVFVSWRAFLYYLQDDQFSKTHHTIVDIFNGTPGSSLNPRGVNLVVLERNADTGHVYGFTASPHTLRRSAQFVVLVKTSTFYEPMYRITMNHGKAHANMFFTYDSSPALRSIIDGVYTRGSGSLTHVLNVLEHRAVSQVVDFGFKCVALVTNTGVTVPVLPPTSVDPSLKTLLHLHDVHALRPRISIDAQYELFARIAAMTHNEGYTVAREERVHKQNRTSALVLRCGFVVPVEILPSDARWDADRRMYLKNLNVFVGTQLPDTRNDIMQRKAIESAAVARIMAKVTTSLQSDSRAMEEYRFLRSSFNPFPLDHRRAKMIDLVRDDIGIDLGKKPGAVIDGLLFGDDVLDDVKSITVATWMKRQPDSMFVLFSDTDLIEGALEAAVSAAMRRQKNYSTESEELRAVLEGTTSTIDTIRTQLNNYGVLSSMNRTARPDMLHQNNVVQMFDRRSKRMPWRLYIDVEMFTVLSMMSRMAGSELSATMLRSVLKDHALGTVVNKISARRIHKKSSLGNQVINEPIDSPAYRPTLSDVETLARACAMNVLVYELTNQGFKKHRFVNQRTSPKISKQVMTSVLLMHDMPQQFDIVLNLQRGKLLTFDEALDVPDIERLLKEVSTQQD